MKRGRFGRQRGATLLAMLFVIAIGASWFYVNRLNAESGGMTAIRMSKNAAVLNRAKQALIGYVAFQADQATEPNPGALPCPENPSDFNSTTGNDGKEGSTCGTTTVGRFPWRTLGLDKLVDAYGEPLWYVVSPGWGVTSGSNSDINSNTLGQLTVNGVTNAAVALIMHRARRSPYRPLPAAPPGTRSGPRPRRLTGGLSRMRQRDHSGGRELRHHRA